MTETTVIEKTDRDKINLRIKLIELAIVTLTLMATLQSINNKINLGLSMLVLFSSIVLIMLSFKFDDFTQKKTITQKKENEEEMINVVDKHFNTWDWLYLLLYLFSIFVLIVELLFIPTFKV